MYLCICYTYMKTIWNIFTFRFIYLFFRKHFQHFRCTWSLSTYWIQITNGKKTRKMLPKVILISFSWTFYSVFQYSFSIHIVFDDFLFTSSYLFVHLFRLRFHLTKFCCLLTLLSFAQFIIELFLWVYLAFLHHFFSFVFFIMWCFPIILANFFTKLFRKVSYKTTHFTCQYFCSIFFLDFTWVRISVHLCTEFVYFRNRHLFRGKISFSQKIKIAIINI